MARRYFETAQAVGRRFRIDDPAGNGTDFEVIGVAADTRTSALAEDEPLFYRSFDQAARPTPTVVVRTTVDPSTLLQPMQQVVRDLGSGLPVIRARTMAQHLADARRPEATAVAILGGLGGLGLALASLGLYAVMAFAVSRQTREIGIRIALGARRGQVVWAVSRNVAALLAAGVTIGLALSWLTVRGSAAMNAGFSQGGAVTIELPSADPVAFWLVGLLMAAVGITAAFFPARRVAKADPLATLRHL